MELDGDLEKTTHSVAGSSFFFILPTHRVLLLHLPHTSSTPSRPQLLHPVGFHYRVEPSRQSQDAGAKASERYHAGTHSRWQAKR